VTVHVFVGPTLAADRVSTIVADATIHPPVAHGDLLRLDLGPGDTVVIIDGYYHQNASVRHKEILALLARGVMVVGCSSMGALRAAELHPFGMIGHGVVFGLYRDGVINGDDEVAVTHSEGPEYRVLSEPLVSIRHAVAAATRFGVLTQRQADAVVRTAGSLHYTERVWPAIERAAGDAQSRSAVALFRTFVDGQAKVGDVKAADAADTLTRLDELTAAGQGRLDWVRSPDWRSRFLYDWEATFAGDTVAGTRVSPAMVAKYQQIYHPEFPDRWRTFVLTRIAGPGDDLPARALRAADAHGVGSASLAPAQLRYWLTRDEVYRLPDQEKLLLALTRSYRMPRMASDLVEAAADLMDDPLAKAGVAESHVVNAEMAANRPGLTIDRIKAAVLRPQLAKIWQVNDGSEDLLAAARNRGFETVEAAIAALRPYFLRQQFRSAVPAKQVTA
jgi:hypothetical protein